MALGEALANLHAEILEARSNWTSFLDAVGDIPSRDMLLMKMKQNIKKHHLPERDSAIASDGLALLDVMQTAVLEALAAIRRPRGKKIAIRRLADCSSLYGRLLNEMNCVCEVGRLNNLYHFVRWQRKKADDSGRFAWRQWLRLMQTCTFALCPAAARLSAALLDCWREAAESKRSRQERVVCKQSLCVKE
jgi:hypothetical protein